MDDLTKDEAKLLGEALLGKGLIFSTTVEGKFYDRIVGKLDGNILVVMGKGWTWADALLEACQKSPIEGPTTPS